MVAQQCYDSRSQEGVMEARGGICEMADFDQHKF